MWKIKKIKENKTNGKMEQLLTPEKSKKLYHQGNIIIIKYEAQQQGIFRESM